MYVRQVAIKKFRHLEGVHLGPFERPTDFTDLIVLAGPNGGGKSSLLELIAYAMSVVFLGTVPPRDPSNYDYTIEFALTTHEQSILCQYLEKYGPNDTVARDVLDYLSSSNTFTISLSGGKAAAYPGNIATGHFKNTDRIGDLVVNHLNKAIVYGHHHSLGFFIRSDRHYPSELFTLAKLFEYNDNSNINRLREIAFKSPDQQYNDMYEFLIQERYHYLRRLGAFYENKNRERNHQSDPPIDPFNPYNALMQELLPGYRFTDVDEDLPRDLYIEIPSGDVIPFSQLSSGEKEVFLILSFFIRYNVNNTLVLVDEPELHLHPELARRFVQNMRKFSTGNQLWVATHNSEIIDEAGQDRVIYLARDLQTRKSIVTRGSDQPQVMQHLRDLFGYAGFIGVAKSLVFLEGLNSSTDRKVFSQLFSKYSNEIKFIPAASSDNLNRINTAVLSILENNLGWMQFYLIRDRDYLTPDTVHKYTSRAAGRLYVLKRHEIENYLIIDEVIANIQTEIFEKRITVEQVRAKLQSIAWRIAGEVLRDMVTFRLNLTFRPEDFSFGNFMKDQAVLNDSGEWQSHVIEAFSKKLGAQVEVVTHALCSRTQQDALNKLIEICQDEIHHALTGPNDGWRTLFPGKRLLEQYAREMDIRDLVAFRNNLIKDLTVSPEHIDPELHQIVQAIADRKQLP